jgi:hypothetical protein
MSVRAGPSQNKPKKAKRPLKYAQRSANVKRATEKEKIDDLERAAAEYVSYLSEIISHCCSLT